MDQLPKDTFPYLFAGYTVIWGLLVLYFLSLGRRLRRLEGGGCCAEQRTEDLGSSGATGSCGEGACCSGEAGSSGKPGKGCCSGD